MAGDVLTPHSLRARRLALGLSQAALGTLLGVSANTVARWERGALRIGSADLVRLALERLEGAPGQRTPSASPAPSAPLGHALVSIPCAPSAPHRPAQLTSFVGRHAEIAELKRRLATTRLLTLVGTGGVGKTRLALEVAAQLSGSWADGEVFVSLAAIRDPALVVPAIAQALGVREAGGRTLLDALVHYLSDRHQLLILDNFEQVLDAGPHLAHLLAACPRLSLLVTSREPLRLYGEREYAVPPLELPDLHQPVSPDHLAGCEAVRLFIERAQDVRPDFALDPQNVGAVAELCLHLDGLPLAIELAAARCGLLPVRGILARLERRFDLLTAGARDRPARHQTLRAAIDWSYDLLRPDQQTLFRRLAVFSGGWSAAAAEGVCGAPLDALAGLAEKGLIRIDEPHDSEPRFRMLETLREYALERLDEHDETEDARRAHASHFLAVAESADSRLRGPEAQRLLADLERDNGNLRAALTWLLSPAGYPGLALRLAGALQWFWFLHSQYSEGRLWLEAALVHPHASSTYAADRARALTGAGLLALLLGDYAAAHVQLAEAQAIGESLADPRLVAYVQHHLGLAAKNQGEHDAWWARFGTSVALFRETGDRWGLAQALCHLGDAAVNLRRPEAGALLAESLALYRELGDPWGLARALHYSGELARAQGDDARAAALYEECLVLYRRLGHHNTGASVLHNLGYVALRQGDRHLAAARFGEGLRLHQKYGDRRNVVMCLAGIASVAAALGQFRRAARLFGAVEARMASLGARPEPIDRAEWDRSLGTARSRLSAPELDAALADGRGATLEDVVADALAVAAAGTHATSRGDAEDGKAHDLTAREREVAALIARGLTNRQIAHTLGMAKQTADRHVSHILAKLGAASRAQVAAWAVQQADC